MTQVRYHLWCSELSDLGHDLTVHLFFNELVRLSNKRFFVRLGALRTGPVRADYSTLGHLARGRAQSWPGDVARGCALVNKK